MHLGYESGLLQVMQPHDCFLCSHSCSHCCPDFLVPVPLTGPSYTHCGCRCSSKVQPPPFSCLCCIHGPSSMYASASHAAQVLHFPLHSTLKL
ncbi:hypothetical protein DUNSADRAFT_3524 [Dunaliella salina]|uniref:Uncharacterized protein n=1 Tax=Dunaliella salina TaxID=3046 RepID=A0ABQ7FVG3_DUNSA|nr:hypothetical protein DUNSADRAFT_3524 [Dunaliella salina]|eukprot:KAF5826328.1 hypothetical protein DUNSADRAFT_3524 [Dunaliella salina]